MSIATRTGDRGTTGLMYNRRVPKHHARIEACGAVDELNAALGLARAAVNPELGATLLAIQQDLIAVMGELATDPADLERYRADGYALLGAERTAWLDATLAALEARHVAPQGWAIPGANPPSAALDFARTVCRRAERRVCALHAAGELRSNSEVLVYLNRLADTLWLMARAAAR